MKRSETDFIFIFVPTDIVERFQLALMLFIIALRNLIELSSSSPSSLTFSLPSTLFSLTTLSNALPTLSLLQTIFSPAIVVLMSECVVDWLKHAFITKFNHIRPAVYGRFVDVLCKDLVVGTGRRQDQVRLTLVLFSLSRTNHFPSLRVAIRRSIAISFSSVRICSFTFGMSSSSSNITSFPNVSR